MKAILNKEIGFKNDNNINAVAIFEMNQNNNTRLILMSDAVVRPYPTFEEKVSIINHCVEVAHILGIENPKVAVLAAFDFVDPQMPETIDAEKLSKISKNHQVLCISHLPSIAAIADYNYFINKNVISNRTIASIKRLDEQEIIHEIARISSGEINDVTLEYATDLRQKRIAC